MTLSLCLLHEEKPGCRAFPLPYLLPSENNCNTPPAPPKTPEEQIPALGAIHWLWLGGMGKDVHSGPKVDPITVLSEGFSVLEMVILVTCVRWPW